jgi:hypothetical protein
MAAKYRAAKGIEPAPAPVETQDETPKRPDHVPEKFWDATKGTVNVDALLKSYGELEKGRSVPQETKPAGAPDAVEKTKDGADQTDAEKVVQSAGLNWDDISSKVETKGELDAADYEALAKAGVPKAIVDSHIALVKQVQAETTAKAVAHAGGQEALDSMFAWAGKSLTPAQVQGYNAMLAGPNWMAALDALKTQYAASRKTAGEPAGEAGGVSVGTSSAGYRSRSEMKADMASPRYRSGDPVFHKQVADKMRFATWDLDR